MSDATIVYLIIVVAVVIFVSGRIPVDLVAIGVAVSLYVTGILTVKQTFAGFGSPTIIFIASLFVVSEALDATGVTAWLGQQLVGRSRGSPFRVLILTMLLVAFLSALITPNGSVAALLPVVVVLAIRLGRSPSSMLIPLAFAAHAGALLVLTGSPVNVIVSEASHDAGAGGFGFFEFGIVGVPLLLGTIVITVGLGPRLLPRRTPRSMPADFSRHARALLTQYAQTHPVVRLHVRSESPFVGRSRDGLDLSKYPDVSVIAAQEEGVSGPLLRPALVAGDVLVVRGDPTSVERLARDNHLEYAAGANTELREEDLFTRESGVAEVVIPPRSEAIGERVFPGMVTESGDLIILSVQRSGEDRPGKTTLAAGDMLLLQGRWDALEQNIQEDSSVLVVDSPDRIRRQLVPLGQNAKVSIAVLAGMVLLLATGVVPPSVAAILAACGLILLRVLSTQEAYRAISWTTVILVAGMIPLTTAMAETGAADNIADELTKLVGDSSPYVLVAALVVLVLVLGQLISNTATALIVIPVAVSAAVELDVSVQPILMAVNVAAAASFLTPVATPANLMVMEPGGYRFGDYWKLGLVMMLWYAIIAIGLVPLVWSF